MKKKTRIGHLETVENTTRKSKLEKETYMGVLVKMGPRVVTLLFTDVELNKAIERGQKSELDGEGLTQSTISKLLD